MPRIFSEALKQSGAVTFFGRYGQYPVTQGELTVGDQEAARLLAIPPFTLAPLQSAPVASQPLAPAGPATMELPDDTGAVDVAAEDDQEPQDAKTAAPASAAAPVAPAAPAKPIPAAAPATPAHQGEQGAQQLRGRGRLRIR